MVQEMLQEECESFSKDDKIGDAKGLQITINLTDTIPVEKIAVLCPLYPNVKQHVLRSSESRFAPKVQVQGS